MRPQKCECASNRQRNMCKVRPVVGKWTLENFPTFARSTSMVLPNFSSSSSAKVIEEVYLHLAFRLIFRTIFRLIIRFHPYHPPLLETQ